MRKFKIESYVPEEDFYQRKDEHFWSSAFEDCFIVDLHYSPTVIASCRGTNEIVIPFPPTADLLTLFGTHEPFILPCTKGTLLLYPAWRHLEFALVFLFKERIEMVEKAYQNAQRYAFSTIFDTDNKKADTPQTELESKLCTLHFYMDRLFGDKRETNVAAHILMIANLVGCRLHEMSVSRINATLDEREMERISTYLFCIFMTMRRFNGEISTSAKAEENTAILTHVPQKYGIWIQQSATNRIERATAFDLPTNAETASFVTHSEFAEYTIEKDNGTLCLHLPLRQKAVLSSVPFQRGRKKLTITIRPLE